MKKLIVFLVILLFVYGGREVLRAHSMGPFVKIIAGAKTVKAPAATKEWVQLFGAETVPPGDTSSATATFDLTLPPLDSARGTSTTYVSGNSSAELKASNAPTVSMAATPAHLTPSRGADSAEPLFATPAQIFKPKNDNSAANSAPPLDARSLRNAGPLNSNTALASMSRGGGGGGSGDRPGANSSTSLTHISGTFEGGDSGTFTGQMNSFGQITGKGISNTSGESFDLSGSTLIAGALTITWSSGSDKVIGVIRHWAPPTGSSEAGFAEGMWSIPSKGKMGAWTGKLTRE